MHGSITGRQPASHPLVVVELDMTVDPHWLCGADYASEGLESGWIVMGRVTSHSCGGPPHIAQILRRTRSGDPHPAKRGEADLCKVFEFQSARPVEVV
jgi:hypothetical protein